MARWLENEQRWAFNKTENDNLRTPLRNFFTCLIYGPYNATDTSLANAKLQVKSASKRAWENRGESLPHFS